MNLGTHPAIQLPPERPNRRVIWLGAAVGILPGLLNVMFIQSKANALTQVAIMSFFASITILPLAALILAGIRSTRRFGLGILLGVGLSWLVMLAICGGLGLGPPH